jgi:osmoprotectant transport system substrate-binding protein
MRELRLMNRPVVLARTALVGLAAVLSVALAACGSSGGGSGASSPAGGNATTAAGGQSTPAGGGASAPPESSTPAGTAAGDGSLATATVSPQNAPAIVMGDKNFAEQYVLGELYSQALRAKGFKVTLKGNIGSSATIDKALTSGQINMYPEYTGVIYTELAKLGERPQTAEVTYAGAKKWENGRGFAVLKPTAFQDKDCVAVLNGFAKDKGLKTIADLKKLSHFSYGGPPENKTRFQGVLGLQKAYGLNNFTFKPISIGLQYTAIDDHKVDSIACFTTDGQLASGKYTILTDTKAIFGFQQVAPVISEKLIKQMPPVFVETLNKVTDLLTSKAIIALNKAVQIDKKDPAEVAKAFLQANGLL